MPAKKYGVARIRISLSHDSAIIGNAIVSEPMLLLPITTVEIRSSAETTMEMPKAAVIHVMFSSSRSLENDDCRKYTKREPAVMPNMPMLMAKNAKAAERDHRQEPRLDDLQHQPAHAEEKQPDQETPFGFHRVIRRGRISHLQDSYTSSDERFRWHIGHECCTSRRRRITARFYISQFAIADSLILHYVSRRVQCARIHRQTICIDPKAEMVITRFASHPPAGNVNLDPTLLLASRAIAEHLLRFTKAARRHSRGSRVEIRSAGRRPRLLRKSCRGREFCSIRWLAGRVSCAALCGITVLTANRLIAYRPVRSRTDRPRPSAIARAYIYERSRLLAVARVPGLPSRQPERPIASIGGRGRDLLRLHQPWWNSRPV